MFNALRDVFNRKNHTHHGDRKRGWSDHLASIVGDDHDDDDDRRPSAARRDWDDDDRRPSAARRDWDDDDRDNRSDRRRERFDGDFD